MGILTYLGCLCAVQAQEREGLGAGSDTVANGVRWATIAIDTGDLAPGHRNVSQHTALGLCLAAVRSEIAYARHTLRVREFEDSIRRLTPEYDTLPPRVTAVAKSCYMRFPLQDLTDDMAQSHVQFALLAREDSAVNAIVQQQIVRPLRVAEEKHDPKQGWLQDRLIVIEELYLAAQPARIAAAHRLVEQLDADPHSDVSVRVLAHDQLMEFWCGHDRFAKCHDEIAAMYALGLHDSIDTARKNDLYYLRSAMREEVLIAFLTDRDSIGAIVQRWKELFLKPATVHVVSQLRADAPIKAFIGALRNAPPTLVATAGLPYVGVIPNHTEHLAPVHADFWFPDTAKSGTIPTPGVVSLVVPLYQCNTHGYMEVLSQAGGEAYDCSGAIVLLRHWQRQLGRAGLKITIVTATNGANVLLGGPKAAAAEAEDLRWYFQDYWKLPATIAVQATPFRQDSVPVPFWSVDTTNARWLSYQVTQRQLDANLNDGEGIWWLIDADGSSVRSLYNKFLETTMFDIATVLLARWRPLSSR